MAKFAANWRYVPTEPDRQMLDIGNMIESSIFTAHLPCPCQSMRPHARLRSAIPTNSVHIARLVQPFHTTHYKYTEGRPIEPDRCHDFTNTGPAFSLLRINLYLALAFARNELPRRTTERDLRLFREEKSTRRDHQFFHFARETSKKNFEDKDEVL